MRICEFVDGLAIRFDSKLNAAAQIDAFEEDCRNHLKKFEGDILGFAYQEIIYQNKSRTHPTIAKIKKICVIVNCNFSSENTCIRIVYNILFKFFLGKGAVVRFSHIIAYLYCAYRKNAWRAW